MAQRVFDWSVRPWLVIAVGAVSLVVGVIVGAVAFGADGDTGPAAGPPSLPDACAQALDEADAQLRLRTEAPEITARYRGLLRRGADALASFDTERLERILGELEQVNRRAERALADVRRDDFEALARRCREETGSA